MRYPEFLKKGSVIGICAPSAGVGRKLESFDLSLETLREEGYEIKETASVRLNDLRGGTASQRGQELNSLFADPKIDMVMAACGGDFLDEMLPYADWELMNKDVRWIMGSSDPTGLLYPYTTKYDVATLYGSNAGSFDLLSVYRHPEKTQSLPYDPDHYDPAYLENVLRFLRGEKVSQESSAFCMKEPSFGEERVAFTNPTCYQASADRIEARGRCIGGCIDVLKDLIGTCYDGTKSFLERYRQDGFIWYFDNFALSADSLYRTLLQMRYAGWFDAKSTKAVIIGRTLFESSESGMSYADGIRMAFEEIPVIWEADIGHTDPHFFMVNGAMLDMKYENGRMKLDFSFC